MLADRKQLQMALFGILTNASEAMGTIGTIRITCRSEVLTEESARPFFGLSPGCYAGLTIRDNGKGMSEETQKRVFEPFSQPIFPGVVLVWLRFMAW